MSTKLTARERFHLINVLGPLGLPIRVIAQAANCSVATIRKDLSESGGITRRFPNRPTKANDVYARTLEFFALQHNKDWEQRPERTAVEEYLNIAEIHSFMRGMISACNILHLPSCRSGSVYLKFVYRIFEIYDEPLAHYTDCQLETSFKRYFYFGEWPGNIDSFCHNLLEDFSTEVDRSNLRNVGHGDLVEAVDEVLALLGKNEAMVLRYRYGLSVHQNPMVLHEIGKIMQLSRGRVQQIEHIALRKLRKQPHRRNLLTVLGLTFGEYEEQLHQLRGNTVENALLREQQNRNFEFYRQVSELLGTDHELVEEYADDFNSYKAQQLLKCIDEFEFSVRTLNCLSNFGIKFIFQIITKKESEMYRIKNFGHKSLKEIREVLDDLGLHFGTTLSPLEQHVIDKFMAEHS